MSGEVYVEKVADPESDTLTVREPVDEDHMWLVFVMRDGRSIRVQHDLDHIYVNGMGGPINIRPESGNAVRISISPHGKGPI